MEKRRKAREGKFTNTMQMWCRPKLFGYVSSKTCLGQRRFKLASIGPVTEFRLRDMSFFAAQDMQLSTNFRQWWVPVQKIGRARLLELLGVETKSDDKQIAV